SAPEKARTPARGGVSRRVTMTLPGETEAGSAGMQPCRGIAWWAHRDDVARGSSPSALSPKTHRIGRPLCLENPRPEGGGALANGGTLLLHFTLNRNSTPTT